MTNSATLQLDELWKKYPNGIEAVRGVSMEVRPGEVFGLVGPNGAGKTTLLKLASGLLFPQRGAVRYGDEDITSRPKRAARHVGLMPDPLGVYTDLSAIEYLQFFAQVLGISKHERPARIDEVVALLELTPWLDEEVETLSAGWQRRLALGRVLLAAVPVLLLDEPAAGLDISARSELLHIVKKLASHQRAIIISSHILPELHQLADRFGVISKGQWIEVVPGRRFFTRDELDQGFGRKVWQVRCNRPGDAQATLSEKGTPARTAPDGALSFEIADEQAAATLLRALVEKGIDVFEFKRTQTELADVVLRAIRQEPPPL